MKISNSKKLATLYKKDLAASKFESLLILGFIIVGNLFLYYKAKTSWPSNVSLVFSTLILGFVPLSTFFRAFSFIRSEWKENTVYFMMSLPTTGNTIFLSKLLALLTQFVILSVVAIIPTISFVLMRPDIQQFWLYIKSMNNIQEVVWEFSKVAIILFTAFGMTMIMAFFSAVVGKLSKKFSGMITFLVYIATNYVVNNLLVKIVELINRGRLDAYVENEIAIGNGIFFWQLVPNSIFVSSLVLIVAASILLFLATTAIYDRKVEL